MYCVMDVCRYIISYCNKKDYPLSNLKLQKLLYFIQAYFLLTFNHPCFRENIEAWDFGPVVPEAYHTYKIYGAHSIPYVFYDPYHDGEDVISEDDKRSIECVLDRFARYTSTELVAATHRQAPWKNVYNPYERHIIISNESIKTYFEGLRHAGK